jgi:hypothetical protein
MRSTTRSVVAASRERIQRSSSVSSELPLGSFTFAYRT